MFQLQRVVKINMLYVRLMKLQQANRQELFANSCRNGLSLQAVQSSDAIKQNANFPLCPLQSNAKAGFGNSPDASGERSVQKARQLDCQPLLLCLSQQLDTQQVAAKVFSQQGAKCYHLLIAADQCSIKGTAMD